MERRVLLETFATHLPPETIRFSSKLVKIEKSLDGKTVLELVDGTRISAKVNSYSLFFKLVVFLVFAYVSYPLNRLLLAVMEFDLQLQNGWGSLNPTMSAIVLFEDSDLIPMVSLLSPK